MQYPLEIDYDYDARLAGACSSSRRCPASQRWAPVLPPVAPGLSLGEGGTALIEGGAHRRMGRPRQPDLAEGRKPQSDLEPQGPAELLHRRRGGRDRRPRHRGGLDRQSRRVCRGLCAARRPPLRRHFDAAGASRLSSISRPRLGSDFILVPSEAALAGASPHHRRDRIHAGEQPYAVSYRQSVRSRRLQDHRLRDVRAARRQRAGHGRAADRLRRASVRRHQGVSGVVKASASPIACRACCSAEPAVRAPLAHAMARNVAAAEVSGPCFARCRHCLHRELLSRASSRCALATAAR